MPTLVGRILKDNRFRELLDEAVIFNIDEIARYYWQSEKIDWNVAAGDFPNIAPPYEKFFMQYNVPKGKIYVEEGAVDIDEEEQFGFLFLARKIDWEEVGDGDLVVNTKVIARNVKWLLGFQMATYMEKFDSVAVDSTRFTVGVDENGQFVPLWGDPDRPMLVDIGPDRQHLYYNDESRKQWINLVFSMLHPCLLAISFLHTRNTVVVSSEDMRSGMSKSQMRHADRKRGEPYYKYHILDIRPLREILRNEGTEGPKGIAKAAHLRRGHFRDYTEGRGLFGKVKGLFWFDSTFVKGKGRVDKDYNVNMPEKK